MWLTYNRSAPLVSHKPQASVTPRGMTMTEKEWFAARERELQRTIGKWSERRQRLLAVAICRAYGEWINYPAAHAALEAAEYFADTGKSKAALRRARQSVVTLRDELFNNRPREAPLIDGGISDALFTIQVAASENAVASAVRQALETLVLREGLTDDAARHRLHLVYRELAGPHLTPAIPTTCRTDTAIALARQMYESREFSAMPILADALQDAGCDDEDILGHCRDPHQVHVRGCWVVDLVLGKA
jgi:hypothetical protein